MIEWWAFVVVGAGWIYGYRQRHDAGGFFWPLGSWQNAPPWLRRLVRSNRGDLHVWSLAMQTWGLLVILLGVAILIGAIPAAYSGVAFTYAAMGLFVPIAFSAAVILLRYGRGERPAPRAARRQDGLAKGAEERVEDA